MPLQMPLKLTFGSAPGLTLLIGLKLKISVMHSLVAALMLVMVKDSIE